MRQRTKMPKEVPKCQGPCEVTGHRQKGLHHYEGIFCLCFFLNFAHTIRTFFTSHLHGGLSELVLLLIYNELGTAASSYTILVKKVKPQFLGIEQLLFTS